MRRIWIIALVTILMSSCGSPITSSTQPTTVPTTDQATNDLPLIGSRWNVLTINGKPLIGPNPLPLAIESATQVSGHGGCNGFGGSLSIDGNNLRIGPLVSTMMACVEVNLQTQEGSLLQALEQVRSYQQTANNLNLLDAQGTIIVSLARQP